MLTRPAPAGAPALEGLTALQLQLRLHALLTRAIAAGVGTTEEVFAPCVQTLANSLHAESVGVWIADGDGAELRLCANTQSEGGTQAQAQVRIGRAHASVLSGTVHPAVLRDPRFEEPLFAPPLNGPERCVIAAPLVAGGRLAGVLAISRLEPLGSDVEEAIVCVADLLAIGVERQHAAARLREREDGLGTLIGTAPDGIVVMDARSRIIAVNPSLERIFGYQSGELTGQDVTILMPERFRSRHNMGVRRYSETGQKRISWHGIELAGVRSDGTEFPIEISFGEYAHNGEVVFTGFIRDITERKRAEARDQRRRRATQLTAVYVGAALVTLQAADLVIPVLPLPAWTFQAIVLLAIAGLPLVTGVAWGFGSVGTSAPAAAGSGPVWLRPATWVAVVCAMIAAAFFLSLPAPVADDDGDVIIAVLPFTDLDDTPAVRQLAGGITEDVLTAVARLDGVRVVSQTSVLASALGGRTVAHIGRELGAHFVLEGSVRQSNGLVRVSARLARVGQDRHVWAETFDRQFDDAFALQTGIAAAIAAELCRRVVPAPAQQEERDLPP
jgi:PAS domain S-box-containing protein